MAAPTLEQLHDAVETWLGTLGFTVAGVAAGTAASREFVLLPKSVGRAYPWIAATEEVASSSNVTRRIVTVQVRVAQRATTPSITNIRIAEQTSRSQLAKLTTLSNWTAITHVSRSPLPEVSVSSEPERIGDVIVFTVRADVALELEA